MHKHEHTRTRPHPPSDGGGRFSVPGQALPQHPMHDLKDAAGHAQLPILLCVCSRDHIAHPKAIPPCIANPPATIHDLPPPSQHTVAFKTSLAIEQGLLAPGLSDGRPAWPHQKSRGLWPQSSKHRREQAAVTNFDIDELNTIMVC